MLRLHSAPGYTLAEITAALSLCGLVLLGGVLLLDQLTTSGAQITRESRRIANAGNGWRLLQQLIGDAYASGDSLDRFRGDDRSVDFTTLCERPQGWFEPCRVNLAIDLRGDTSVARAHLSTSSQDLVLGRWGGTAAFRYFERASADSTWTARWASVTTVPSAIAVVAGGDTALYALGASRE